MSRDYRSHDESSTAVSEHKGRSGLLRVVVRLVPLPPSDVPISWPAHGFVTGAGFAAGAADIFFSSTCSRLKKVSTSALPGLNQKLPAVTRSAFTSILV